MTSDEFDRMVVQGAVKLMLEKERKFHTLLGVDGRVLAKEFEGEMWIKAAHHDQAVKQAVEAEQEKRTEKYPIAFTHEEYNAVIQAALAYGAAEEREACAKLCEEFATDAVKEQDFHSVVTAEDCAACIRARGQE